MSVLQIFSECTLSVALALSNVSWGSWKIGFKIIKWLKSLIFAQKNTKFLTELFELPNQESLKLEMEEEMRQSGWLSWCSPIMVVLPPPPLSRLKITHVRFSISVSLFVKKQMEATALLLMISRTNSDYGKRGGKSVNIEHDHYDLIAKTCEISLNLFLRQSQAAVHSVIAVASMLWLLVRA